MVDTVDPGNAFAEKLGQWIHFADAITLSGVHNGSAASSPKTPARRLQEGQGAAHAAAAEFDRIQAYLVDSIVKSFSPAPGKMHNKLPAPQLELPMNVTGAYLPYRRFYEAHQRDMELRIQPLRCNVRAAVAKAAPWLKKLADLDATLEKILQEREAHLLSKVPGLLRKRFEQLFKEHLQQLVDAGQADSPASWVQAGGWLARFCHDMQMLLLAEVALRLQPTMGLIEAFKQDTR